MTEQGYPFDGQTTDEQMWRRLMRWIMASGVLRGEDDALLVGPRGAGANMSVDVASGQAFAVGHYYRSDAVVSLAIGNNGSGNPRIDTVVVGWDFAANTASVYVLPGVTAAAPAPADLTQDLAAKWEIPLAYIYVAAGESTSIDVGEIADARQWAGPVEHAPQVPVVRLATTAALAASTITGLERVANANGALANIDGTAPAVNDDVLDKDDATGAVRGIWRIVDLGSATKPWRMVRSPIADTSAKVRAGLWVRAVAGTANGGHGFLLTTADPIVLGVTALTFTQFPASLALTSDAGSMVSNTTLPAATITTLVTTGSLAVGTWLVTAGVLLNAGSTSECEATLDVGTATATFAGKQSAGATTGAAVADLTVSCIVTVTVAGTLLWRARSVQAGTAFAASQQTALPKATGYTAVKIA